MKNQLNHILTKDNYQENIEKNSIVKFKDIVVDSNKSSRGYEVRGNHVQPIM